MYTIIVILKSNFLVAYRNAFIENTFFLNVFNIFDTSEI